MDTQASIQLEESTSIVCVTTSTYKRHPGEVSINDDEVIILYIEAFLISKSVSPAELEKIDPGSFFSMPEHPWSLHLFTLNFSLAVLAVADSPSFFVTHPPTSFFTDYLSLVITSCKR